MDELNISEEFLEENKQNLRQFAPKSRRRGPYSKIEKERRREEIYRLHFDYGYSARKIADLMKIERNTINADLNFVYANILENTNIIDPATTITLYLERLDIQYLRLRERYDKTGSNQEKNTIEKLMLDVNSRIISTNQRISESTVRVMDSATERLNEWLKDERSNTRYITMFDRFRVSIKAKEKIQQIIKADQKKGDFW